MPDRTCLGVLGRWDRRPSLAVVAVAALVGVLGACQTGDTVDSTSTSTSTTVTSPSATATPTTTSPTTTSTTASATVPLTTTMVQPPRIIGLAGAEVLYSTDGVVQIEGWIGDSVKIAVNGAQAESVTEPGGYTTFWSDLSLPKGEHVVDITATNGAGPVTSNQLTVIVDPSLEQHLAYLPEVDTVGGTVVADYVEWLTGDDAIAAQVEDGEVTNAENALDFYIRNRNPRLRTLTLADDPMIILYACYEEDGPCLTHESVDATEWEALLAAPESGVGIVGYHWYGGGGLPYWLMIDDGVVVQISEHYLP